MPLDQQTRRYQRNFTKDELSLLRQTVEGETEFCRKQIQIADDEEDDRNIKDKKHILERVVKTYNELIDEYKSIERKLQESYEE
jgi:hypothetical protein